MSAYRWLKTVSIAALMAGILFASACIPTSPEYSVQFIIDDGIIGTPASGTYTYREFDEIPYKYTPSSDAVIWPVVYINGVRAKAEDTMAVYNYTTVEVRQIDVRNDAVNQDDQWQFALYNKQGGEVAAFRLRFVGTSNKSGYFSDDRKNYYGTWVITESKKLTMTYLNWEDAVLVGDISTMTGVWTISSDPDALSWKASRK